MKITVDANIMFACLIKDSATRKIFFNPVLDLFAPGFIVDELLEYIAEISKKSGLRDDELYLLIDRVFGQVTLVPDRDLKVFLPAAASLVKDSKDWLYLACALYKDTAIWSNDGGFAFQRRVKIFTTKELVKTEGFM